MTISIDAEKSTEKIQHSFIYLKNPPEIKNRMNMPQYNKITYDKTTANIILMVKNGAYFL